MKKHLEKNKILIISFIIVLIGISFSLFPIKVEQVSSIISPSVALGEIKENDVIKGYFKTTGNNMNSIGLKFSTYGKINKHGKIKVILKENDEKIIKEQIFNVKDISDNSYIYIGFDKQKDSDKKIYTVTLSFDEYYDDIKLTTWGSDSISEDNYMTLNNAKNNFGLHVNTRAYYKTYDIVLYSIIGLSICLIMYALEGGKKNDRKNKK